MAAPPTDWSPTALAVLSEPLLSIPLLSAHPLWLACIGEVLTWRNRMGTESLVVDFTAMGLFDSDEHSHFARANHVARAIQQDSVTRLRRYLATTSGHGNTSWLDASHFLKEAKRLAVPAKALDIAALNVTSESLSLTNSRFVDSLLPSPARERMTETWRDVFRTYLAVLEYRRPSAVLLFNGRFVKEGAARAAAVDQDIPTYGFDQGPTKNSWAVYRNHVHDYDQIVQNVEYVWQNGDPERLQREYSLWLKQRIGSPGGGGNQHSASFGDVSPFSGAASIPRVAVFTSSSDELMSIDSESRSGPDNQVMWIRDLVMLARAGRVELQIRVHPNTSTKHELDVQEWEVLAQVPEPNILIHLPESRVNSYALAREADVVLTFGSTLTAEAAFMGKPVVELCDTHLSRLGVCCMAESLASLEPFLADPASALLPHQQIQAIKYAAWLHISGEPLHYARLSGVDGEIAGRSLEPFGKIFRVSREVYHYFVGKGLPRALRSRHGLSISHSQAGGGPEPADGRDD